MDTENSSTGDAGAAPGETADAALKSFATEGFLDLDGDRGTLRVVNGSASEARAQYTVEGKTWAVIRLRRGEQWRVDAVTWCGSAERSNGR